MKKADVKVGNTYAAKVSGKVVPVRIDAESRYGGWDATNLATKKRVRIKSAQRLRGPWPTKGAKGNASAKAAAKDATRANVGGEGAAPGDAKAVQKDRKKAKAPRKKRPSLLDLAAEVLAKATEPMDTKAIVEKVLATGRWQTKGKTPAATLYSAIIREIAAKGKDGRFRKEGRGRFVHAGKEA